jgi:hypothetical protein
MFSAGNKVLRQLSQLDETFGYYYDIIASFKDDLTTGSAETRTLEKAEKMMQETSDSDGFEGEFQHPVYNLDHDGVAQRAWNLTRNLVRHKHK